MQSNFTDCCGVVMETQPPPRILPPQSQPPAPTWPIWLLVGAVFAVAVTLVFWAKNNSSLPTVMQTLGLGGDELKLSGFGGATATPDAQGSSASVPTDPAALPVPPASTACNCSLAVIDRKRKSHIIPTESASILDFGTDRRGRTVVRWWEKGIRHEVGFYQMRLVCH